MSMTQTTKPESRINWSQVRPGMTVRAYDGTPIEVTAIRHTVRLLDLGRGWVRTVQVSGWYGWSGDSRYTEACFQLPERSTHLLRDDAKAKAARFWASVDDDAAIMRSAHSYSTRLLELDTCIRI
jgi:hypothetical protein